MTRTSPPRRWRTLWISDLHLGSPGSKAKELVAFLRRNRARTLYLVGDVVDGWAVRHAAGWTADHDAVVREVLRAASEGTRVVYLPGNHDSFAREFEGHAIGRVEVRDQVVHTTADGRRLWVLHGDKFDPLVKRGRWAVPIVERVLGLLRFLHVPDTWRLVKSLLGNRYRTLAAALAARTNTAMVRLVDFERSLALETLRRGYEGVVCGHTHCPTITRMEGVLYANDGDWVTSMTALVEDRAGALSLLRWRPSPARPGSVPGRQPIPPRRRRPRRALAPVV